MSHQMTPVAKSWTRATALALMGLGLALSASPGFAQASSTPADAQVLVILARAEGPMDAELKKIEALQKAPFSSFKSMAVLKKHAVSLAQGKPVDVPLPNGRKLQLTMLSAQADGRFKIRVSLNKPKKKDYLPLLQVVASPGEPFFIAGQSFEGGTMIIGVQVNATRKPVAK